jgi:hypothetical protein
LHGVAAFAKRATANIRVRNTRDSCGTVARRFSERGMRRTRFPQPTAKWVVPQKRNADAMKSEVASRVAAYFDQFEFHSKMSERNSGVASRGSTTVALVESSKVQMSLSLKSHIGTLSEVLMIPRTRSQLNADFAVIECAATLAQVRARL